VHQWQCLTDRFGIIGTDLLLARIVMLDTSLLVSLVTFATIAAITPGGATLLAVASGVRFGLRRSIGLLSGMALGMALLSASAAAGMGALLNARPEVQTLMQMAGSAYLIWLAWQIGCSGKPRARSDADPLPLGPGAGLLLLWLNPKAWAVSLGAASAYARLIESPATLALTIGTIFGMAALGSMILWCLGGVLLGRLLSSERQWRLVNIALGVLLALSVLLMWL
jgi:threonine/homoserine/homoserine lactone efflux protein